MRFGRRRRSFAPDPVAVARLREGLARDRRVVLPTSPWLMLGGGLLGLASLVLLPVMAARTSTDPPSKGMVAISAVMALVGLGMAFVNRHPVVVDESGLHARGPLHFDIEWADIREVVVTTSGGAPRYDRQIFVRVDPASLSKYAQTHGPWGRLTTRLARAMGVASLGIPPLRISPETAAAFIQEEAHARRGDTVRE